VLHDDRSKQMNREKMSMLTTGQNLANILQGNLSHACNMEPSFAGLILIMEVTVKKHQICDTFNGVKDLQKVHCDVVEVQQNTLT